MADEEKDKGPSEAETKSGVKADPQPKPPTPPPADPAQEAAAAAQPEAEHGKRSVRVISKGYLGPKLLKFGDETDDPDYVAILKQKGQRKVVEIK